MTLKQRIWGLPVVAGLLFLIGIAVVAWFSVDTSHRIRKLGAADYPYMDQMTQFSSGLETLVATIQSAVAEGEVKRLDEANEKAASLLKLLAAMKSLDGKAAAASSLETQFRDYEKSALEAARIILGKASGDQAAAVTRMQGAQKTLETSLGALRTEAREGVNATIGHTDRSVTLTLLAMVGTAVLVISGLGFGSWVLMRSVWGELGGEPHYARLLLQNMASGDLSQQVSVDGNRVHSLLGAMREMNEGLAGIVSSVREGSDSIAIASAEIATGNLDLSTRTEQTASRLQQTASSLQHLTSTVRHSAESAHQANELAHSACGVAQRGGQMVAQVVKTMQDIDTSSKRIADIIGVIDGIAFQTNILALNAAVEAARAGEQGRGFAVVASEVRSLAQRSAEAAREIKGLIGANVDRVQTGTRLVGDAGSTMNDIVASVQRVTDIIGEISAAAEEQSSGIGQVNIAVGDLDRMTQQNAALVEESAAAAESLKDQALRLAEGVSRFRLDAGSRAEPGTSNASAQDSGQGTGMKRWQVA